MGVDGELHNNSIGMLSEASETEFLSAVAAVNGWMDELMDDQMDGCLNAWKHGRKDRGMVEWRDRWTDYHRVGLLVRCVNA